jgi:hypothetical protein
MFLFPFFPLSLVDGLLLADWLGLAYTGCLR